MFNEIVTQYGSSEPIKSSVTTSESSDKKIVISFPLLMRIMEWCHEDAKDDVEMHKVMEKLIAFNDGINPLTIDVYDCLIADVSENNCQDMVEPMQTGCFSEYDMTDAVSAVKKSYDEMIPLDTKSFSWKKGLDDNSTTITLNGDEECSSEQPQEVDAELEEEIQNLINLSKL